MNVLITGIDGFVGSHLAQAHAHFPNVHLFGTTFRQSQNPPARDTVKRIETDITNFDSVLQAVEISKPDRVFHLAGQAFVPHSVKDPLGTFNANINGTLHILEAVRRRQQEVNATCSVLAVSSGEVYGDVSLADLPINEDAPLRPSNPYAASKAAADILSQQYRSSFGLDVVVTRPFNHLGPGQSELFVGSAFAKQVAEIKAKKREAKIFVGNLDPERDFTDVRDVVRAYIGLSNGKQEQSVFNVCTGVSIPIKRILELLLQFAGVKAEILLDTSRIRGKEIPKITGDSSRLQMATGWKPEVPIEQTLRDLLAYWEDRIGRNG